MVANLLLQDYRYNYVYCFTDTTVPADSIITINGVAAKSSTVYTSNNGWSPSVSSLSQGIIGFSFVNNSYVFGDPIVISNSTGTINVSSYAGSTTNLQLYLDASLQTSYPGNGTTWSDISKSGPRSCTLTNGPTFSTASNGTIVFDGVDDYVACGNLGSFYYEGTISFWMNSTAVENYRNPFSTAYLAGNACIRFEQYTTASPYGGFNVVIGNDAGTYTGYSYSPSAVISPNTWYNFVIAWNTGSSALSGYMNGINKFVTNSHVYWPSTLPSVTIGSGFDSGRYYKGSIANLQIYNRAINAVEVFQNYNSFLTELGLGNSIVANSLVAFFDSSNTNSYPGTGSTWVDISNNGNSATVSGSPTFSNGVFTFNGVDQFFFINTSTGFFNYNTNSLYADVGYAWSVGAWFRFPTSPTVVRDSTVNGGNCSYCIIGKSGGIGGAETISLFVSANNSTTSAGALFPYLLVVGIRGSKTQISPGPVNTNTWNYVAVTWNGTAGRVYLNGVDRGVLNIGTAGIQTASYLCVGCTANAPSAHGFEGSISQVNIYSRALTNYEVSQNFNAFKTRFGVSDPIVTDGLVLYLDAGDVKSYPGSGLSWYDISGGSTVLTAPTTISIATFNNARAFNFDAVGKYFNATFSNNIATSVTLEAWIYPNSSELSAGDRGTVILLTGTNGLYMSWNKSTGALSNYWYGHPVEGYHENAAPSSRSTWSHWCSVWDNSTGKLYQYTNGVKASVDASSQGNAAAGTNLIIGRESDNRQFAGGIAIIRIYNRALSTSEVVRNFAADKYRFGL